MERHDLAEDSANLETQRRLPNDNMQTCLNRDGLHCLMNAIGFAARQPNKQDSCMCHQIPLRCPDQCHDRVFESSNVVRWAGQRVLVMWSVVCSAPLLQLSLLEWSQHSMLVPNLPTTVHSLFRVTRLIEIDQQSHTR